MRRYNGKRARLDRKTTCGCKYLTELGPSDLTAGVVDTRPWENKSHVNTWCSAQVKGFWRLQCTSPSNFSASVVSCSMVRPLLVVEENCQLSTSATWSHVPTGGLVKKLTFCGDTTGPQFKHKPRPPPQLTDINLKGGVQAFSTRGCCLTFGWLVSMLYHSMEAQALGIWQILEMTTTGREWVCITGETHVSLFTVYTLIPDIFSDATTWKYSYFYFRLLSH